MSEELKCPACESLQGAMGGYVTTALCERCGYCFKYHHIEGECWESLTVKGALQELGRLFPEPQYTSQITIDTKGLIDIDVFRNDATDCSNVWNCVGKTSLYECVDDARKDAEESKRMSLEIGG